MATALALTPTAADDRRASARYALELQVSGGSEHQFFTGFTENISNGGLFIATYQTLPLGSRFDITFTLPGIDKPFEADCVVCWVREYNDMEPDTKPGMGVRFLNLDPESTRFLDRLLTRVETIFYEE